MTAQRHQTPQSNKNLLQSEARLAAEQDQGELGRNEQLDVSRRSSKIWLDEEERKI